MPGIIFFLQIAVLAVMLLILLAAAFLLTPFALPLFARGAPYVPSGRKTIERMLDLALLKVGERMLDIGSGDGRIVIAAARRGIIAHGVELNPWLVWWSRLQAKMFGFSGKAAFTCGNLWSFDTSGFDVITVYGLSPIMRRLGEKLSRELQPGARVVSHGFRFPDWQTVREVDGVYLYEVKVKSHNP